MSGEVYLRRVRDPSPLYEQLARDAVDDVERRTTPGTSARTMALWTAAERFGVPLGYVFDELERRVRERGLVRAW